MSCALGSSGEATLPILLLGAGGQLGQALIGALSEIGPLVALTRADADLDRLADLRATVREVAPRVIVNAAAYTAVDAAESDAARCRRVNTDAPGLLAEEASRLGIPLVYFSTNYVFDGAATRPYREDDPLTPLSIYGQSKADGERKIIEAGADHVILRTNGLYGGKGANFVKRILSLGREREELRIVADQRSAPTHVQTVASVTVAVTRRLLSADGAPGLGGIYHVTSGGEVTWFDFARRILELDPERAQQRVRSVIPIDSKSFAAPARRPANGVLDTTRVQRVLGIVLPHWETALAEHLCTMG